MPRSALLVVAGSSGVGKSTICAALAGSIPDAVLLDADVLARVIPSAQPPGPDYPAFWRALAEIAAGISANGVAVVWFSVMLPSQLLDQPEVLRPFSTAEVLVLEAPASVLAKRRATRRTGVRDDDRWARFAVELRVEAIDRALDRIDADRALPEVTADVARWIRDRVRMRARGAAADVPRGGGER